MNTLQVSVVIPTYNRRAMLDEMLTSLSEQTYPTGQFEVIVVVDGCQDGTWEMLQGIQTPFALRPVFQQQAGVSTARNLGSYLARGSVLLFLDDDLLPEPGLLQEHMLVHGQDQQAVVLGRFLPAKWVRGRDKGGWNVWEERVLAKHYQAMQEGRRPPAGRRLYSGNFSVRREFFRAVGGFDECLRRGEDVELGMRLEQLGLRFHFNPRAAAVHRGYRSFASWCRSAYLYGHTDVRLSTEKGFPVLPQIFQRYYQQPALARQGVALCLGRQKVRGALVQTLRVGSGVLTCLGLHILTHPGYSGIYKLLYWQGVADELGGRKEFYRRARAFKQGWEAESPASQGVSLKS